MRSPSADRLGLLVAAAYLVAALHGLGAADVVGDDEAREVGIVQDVVRGQWLWPRFNDELLPDKPILYHWLAAVPCALAGFSAGAARLPAAVAGAILVGWTARFGGALFGAPAGVVAAGLLATMPALFTHARVARPDTLLVLLLSVALGYAFAWWRDRRRRDATLALVLLGAATCAKGPVAPALFVLTLAGFLAWQRDLGRSRGLLTLPGIVGFAVLGLGWYALALGGWGELFVREHFIGRYLRNLAGGLASGHPYSPKPLRYHLLFYVNHLPVVALPWTPVVVLALWQAARHGGLRDPRQRFLLCWAVAPVVAFTPAEWKLRYYLLPCLPPLALLAAPAVLSLWHAALRPLARRTAVTAAAVAALLPIVGLWIVTSRHVELSQSDVSTLQALGGIVPGGLRNAAAGVGFAGGALVVATAYRGWRALVTGTAAAVVAWMLLGVPALERAISDRDSLRPFAEGMARHLAPNVPIVFFPETIRTVAVYAGHSIATVRRRRELPPGTAVVTSGEAYASLRAAAAVGPPLLESDGRIGNVARGHVVLAAVQGGGPSPDHVVDGGDDAEVVRNVQRDRREE